MFSAGLKCTKLILKHNIIMNEKVSNEAENPALNKGAVIRSKWLALSDDEKNIMGRPNFACGKIAHRMRAMGFEVAEKAEEEQALVIWTMLEFYKEFGKDWSNKMNEWLKAG